MEAAAALAASVAVDVLGQARHRAEDFAKAADQRAPDLGFDLQALDDQSGLKHILERHHPNFWNSTPKATQSFFPKNMSVDEIRSAIGDVLKQNAARVGQIGPNGVGQMEGTVNGTRYVLGLNRGRVGQFYPVGP